MSPAPATLMLCLALAAPSLWASLVQGTLPPEVAIQRLLIILLVVSVGAAALRGLFNAYTRTNRSHGGADSTPDRRSSS